MDTNFRNNGEDELRAARLTAHALGQTDAAERTEIEAQLADSPEDREAVEQARSLAERLREATAGEPKGAASPELRAKIERRLAKLEPAAGRAATTWASRRWVRGTIRFVAASLLLAAMPAYLYMTSDREKVLHKTGPIASSVSERAFSPAISGSGIFTHSAPGVWSPLNSDSQVPSDIYGIVTGSGAIVPGDTFQQILTGTDSLVLSGSNIHIGDGAYKSTTIIADSPFVNSQIAGDPINPWLQKYSQAPQSVPGGAYSNYVQPSMARGMAFGAPLNYRPYYGLATVTGTPGGDTSGKVSSGTTSFTGGNLNVGGGGDTSGNVASGTTGGQQFASNGDAPPPETPYEVFGDSELLKDWKIDVRGYFDLGETINTDHLGSGYNKPAGADLGGTFQDSHLRADLSRTSAGSSGSHQQDSPTLFGNVSGSGAIATDDPEKSVRGFNQRVVLYPNGQDPKIKFTMATKAGGDPFLITETTASHDRRTAFPESDQKKNPDDPNIKNPFETWKPSHLTPNTSRLMVGDNEVLPLKGMQVDVRIDGFRARVVLDLYYFNDRPQQLEGSFQLRLPEEASPYFVAFGRTVYQAAQITPQDSMFFKREQVSLGDTTPDRILSLRSSSWEQPKVARMVPKEKAAFAYRETVRRRVDPALLEWSGAGVFQCRVFPLAPQSLHRVVIGYDVDLLPVGDDLELRLDLPEHTPACIVDLNMAASDAKEVSLDAPAAKSADGKRLSYRLIDPKDRPLNVRLRKPGTIMLTGADEATGNYFATRVGLSLPETPADAGSKEAVFLVDTSLSAGPQFALWTKLMRATLENNRDRIDRFAVLFFNVETFWWQEKFVKNTPENVAALMQYTDGLALEGATDLGRALKEAASPAWRKKADGLPPEMFLLSDGAATWGEDRWPLLVKALTPCPSPASGRGEPRGPLYAYFTGMSGSDARTLALLAEQTDGAVFSVVGEAEIAKASVAHRTRPWKLTGVEVNGGHDVLVAGRPRYVFPDQQLLVVGRLESKASGGKQDALTPKLSPAAGEGEMVFTLQQGTTTQTVRVNADRTIASELAARAYGQVATGQLEDLDLAAEPVATVYARHFRITGRTCSLLMLESEQDYARYNIKPEEDDFVVKDKPASPIVKAATNAGAPADAKTLFMDWYRRLGKNEQVRFDLPASLGIALESLPAESFEVDSPALHCKLRMQKDLPERFRQPWRTGRPDYETLATESERRLRESSADDALRALSSLVEERPGDTALARDVAFTSIAWDRPGAAYHLLRRAASARTFEPVTFHAMAHCMEQLGNTDLAIIYYELACAGQWDARFGDMHNIAQMDYLRFLRRLDGGTGGRLGDYARSRMTTLAASKLRDTADVAALILWNTDGTDVDLHVTEPSGEECFFQHTQTASGGRISRDVTTGYGPELYLLPQAPAGKYDIRAHYYASDANRASTRTKVLALIYQGWGTKDEKLTVKAVPLTGSKESHELASVQVAK